MLSVPCVNVQDISWLWPLLFVPAKLCQSSRKQCTEQLSVSWGIYRSKLRTILRVHASTYKTAPGSPFCSPCQSNSVRAAASSLLSSCQWDVGYTVVN